VRFKTVLMVLSTALLGACGEDDDSVVCPAVWVPAVRMTVVDARGAAVQDARVTYRLDGGAEQDADCAQRPQPQSTSCLEWETRNKVGTYVVRATSADGLRSDSEEVSVTGGECGPGETTDVQLVLPD
jgi:hypothetical protein